MDGERAFSVSEYECETDTVRELDTRKYWKSQSIRLWRNFLCHGEADTVEPPEIM
jgi:hypothetical protein